jgi:hypothetical protein
MTLARGDRNKGMEDGMGIKRIDRYLSRLILLSALVTLLMVSCNVFQFLVPPTPTPTQTFTPTPTFTPSPTSMPTETPTPTATPIQFTVVTQADGSTLVDNQVVGYQFVLPKVWIVGGPSERNPFSAFFYDGLVQVSMRIITEDYEHALTDELADRKGNEISYGDKLISSAVTTNGYGTALGYIRYKEFIYASIHGSIYGEAYIILFIVDDNLVSISIRKGGRYQDTQKFSSADIQAIQGIQNSIKIK